MQRARRRVDAIAGGCPSRRAIRSIAARARGDVQYRRECRRSRPETRSTIAAEDRRCADTPRLARLSPREHEILGLLSEGLTGGDRRAPVPLARDGADAHPQRHDEARGQDARARGGAHAGRSRPDRHPRARLAARAVRGEQLHQQPVAPRPVRGSLVLPHDAHAREPDGLVAADRPLVAGRRGRSSAGGAHGPRSGGRRARRRPRGRVPVPPTPRPGRGRCRRCGTADPRPPRTG